MKKLLKPLMSHLFCCKSRLLMLYPVYFFWTLNWKKWRNGIKETYYPAEQKYIWYDWLSAPTQTKSQAFWIVSGCKQVYVWIPRENLSSATEISSYCMCYSCLSPSIGLLGCDLCPQYQLWDKYDAGCTTSTMPLLLCSWLERAPPCLFTQNTAAMLSVTTWMTFPFTWGKKE